MSESLLAVLRRFYHVYPKPPFPEDSLVLTVADQLIAVDLTGVPKREQELLQAMAQVPSTHPWARFLTGQGQAPNTQPSRGLQFTLNAALPAGDQATWLNALQALFDHQPATFYLTATLAVVIEPQSAVPYTAEQLLGIVDTLDSDFGTQTRVYCGRFWPVDTTFPAIFAEEQRLAAAATNRVSQLQTTGLSYYTKTARQSSPLLAALQAQIAQDPEMRPVIASLYQHLGNLTATAKALYLHRNTLQYRIERFQNQTGFSLKQMDDLVLCYLLL